MNMRIYLHKVLDVRFQRSRKTNLYTINRLRWQRGALPPLRGNSSPFGLVLCKNARDLTAFCQTDLVFDGKPVFRYS